MKFVDRKILQYWVGNLYDEERKKEKEKKLIQGFNFKLL